MAFFLATEKEVMALKSSTAEGFAKVKADVDTLYQWINYLYAQNQQLLEQIKAQKALIEEQKLALHELRVTLAHMPKTADEIKRVVDAYYNFEPLLTRLKHIEARIEELESKKKLHHSEEISYQIPPSSQFLAEKTSVSNLKEKIVRRLVRNSKNYIKNFILGLVHKYGKISSLQLRDIVVDEQGLCSKSSFYRILEEMEKEGSVSSHGADKNKTFVAIIKADKS